LPKEILGVKVSGEDSIIADVSGDNLFFRKAEKKQVSSE